MENAAFNSFNISELSKGCFMKRKFGFKLVLLVLLLLCLSSIFILFKYDTLSEYIVSDRELEDIKSMRVESNESLICTLNFNNNDLFFDPYSQTFYYSLINGDSKAYDPPVKFEAADSHVRLAVGPVNISAETISSNAAITIIAYNEKNFSQYSLKCSTLPLMNIMCPEEISDEKVHMQLKLFDNQNNCTIRNIDSDGFIHLRGATTKRFPKKGYRISLTQSDKNGSIVSNKCSLLDMRKDDDWLLYAAYNDQEKIRHVFSTNLWKFSCAMDNSLGLDNGMEYKYIELFINNEYYGLYALGYPIDEKQLKIDKESDTEFLYKKIGWNNESEINDIAAVPVDGYETKSISPNAWLPLRNYFVTVNSEHIQDNSILYKNIDIDNAIDIYLFFNLIQGADNVIPTSIKNIFIAAKEQNGFYKMIFTPWDMDVSWGNDFEGTDTFPYVIPPSQNWLMEVGGVAPLIDRNDPDIWKLIFNKYCDLRNTAWSEDAINALIDEYEKDIFGSGAYLRDMERWPDGLYTDPDQKLSVFRQHVMQRLSYMDLYYGY